MAVSSVAFFEKMLRQSLVGFSAVYLFIRLFGFSSRGSDGRGTELFCGMRSSALAAAVVRDLCSGRHLSGRTQLFGLLLNVACRLNTQFHTIPNSRTCAGAELRLGLDRPLSNMPSWGDRALTGAGPSAPAWDRPHAARSHGTKRPPLNSGRQRTRFEMQDLKRC